MNRLDAVLTCPAAFHPRLHASCRFVLHYLPATAATDYRQWIGRFRKTWLALHVEIWPHWNSLHGYVKAPRATSARLVPVRSPATRSSLGQSRHFFVLAMLARTKAQ